MTKTELHILLPKYNCMYDCWVNYNFCQFYFGFFIYWVIFYVCLLISLLISSVIPMLIYLFVRECPLICLSLVSLGAVTLDLFVVPWLGLLVLLDLFVVPWLGLLVLL